MKSRCATARCDSWQFGQADKRRTPINRDIGIEGPEGNKVRVVVFEHHENNGTAMTRLGYQAPNSNFPDGRGDSLPRGGGGARDRSPGGPVNARVGLLAVVALIGLAACGSGGAAPSGARREPDEAHGPSTSSSTAIATTTSTSTTSRTYSSGPFAVGSEDFVLTDPSRSTTPNRGAVGHVGRVLQVRAFLPLDATGHPMAGPNPMFVWLHGLDATVSYFEPMLREWAARGYVVIAPTFPLTSAGAPGGTVYNDYVNQPADVTFVLTQMLSRYGIDGTVHPGLVDANRIGVGGHSLGAVTTEGLVSNRCCLDSRVRAAVEIDGAPLAFPNGAPVANHVPVLIIHGDADTTFPVADGREMFAAAAPPKFLAILHGMPHTAFRIPAARSAMVSLVGDFLDAYLEQRPGAVDRLAADAQASGITTLTAASS